MSPRLRSAPAVTVPGGTVAATHRHSLYGPCVIVHDNLYLALIRTSNGTALVPNRTLSRIA